MCSFWKCAFMAMCRWNLFPHAGHAKHATWRSFSLRAAAVSRALLLLL
jgi:hypothetical protein